MAGNERGALLPHIRAWAGSDREPLPDRELLSRFVARGDEAAFEAVVRRHGPTVLGVARRVLGNAADAEDVFQATFLALARKASSERWQESAAGWLCETARRLALEARARSSRRRRREDRAHPRPDAGPLADISLREAQAILDEELTRLPEKYRTPLILCCLEGSSRAEAARRLGRPLGTLKRRLEQGRDLLRARLARRGLTAPAALLTLELCPGPSAAVPEALLGRCTRAAATVAAGTLRGAGLAQARIAWAGALLAVLVAGVAGLLARQGASLPPPARRAVSAAAGAAPRPAGTRGEDLPKGAIARLGAAGMRHGPGICGSALSADGRLLATSSGRSVAVWDLRAAKRLRFFPCDRWPHYSTTSLNFSPDGKLLGYVHNSSFACVWDLTTGKEVRRFEGEDGVSCLFTTDGRELVLIGEEKIHFHDLSAGKPSRAIKLKRAKAISPDGRTFARLGTGRIHLGDVRTGRDRLVLDVDAKQDGIENGIAFSPDGKAIALVEQKKWLHVLDATTGKVLALFRLPDSAFYQYRDRRYWQYHVGFSADGGTLLLGTRGGLVHRWDLASPKGLTPLKTHHGAVTGVHAPRGGRTVVSTGADGVVRLWHAGTGRETSPAESYVGRTQAAYPPRGGLAAAGDASGRLDLWDAAKGKLLRVLRRSGPAVTRLAFTADGKTLAAAAADGKVRLWDVPSGRQGKAISCEGQKLAWVLTVAFSPNGRALCVIDGGYQMRLYETATGKVAWRGYSACAGFSPDGAMLAASDGAITVGANSKTDLAFLDASTGKPIRKVGMKGSPNGRHNGVHAVAFAPGGKLLATAPVGGSVCLCDARTGKEVRRFRAAFPPRSDDPFFRAFLDRLESQTRAGALAFSPDGKLLATGGSDGFVRIHEVATGETVLEWKGHEGEALYLAFGADGRSLLSSGEDAQVYLWSLRPAPDAKPTLDALWAGLAGGAKDAYRAEWAMSEAASAPGFLRKKIHPGRPLDEARLAKWIAELGSDSFAVREAASAALEGLGDRVAPALRRALEAKPDLEVRHRLRKLLDAGKKGPPAEELRGVRAVQALELLASVEARRVLRAWAGGAADARLTREAKEALQRLRDRANPVEPRRRAPARAGHGSTARR
jgi:RNA polymerase sigma factor (sigma-70 family)